MKRRRLSQTEIAELRSLAHAGYTYSDIQVFMDVGRPTVARYAKGINAHRVGPPRDLTRLKRIVAAADCADRGCGADLANRFGLASGDSFWAYASYARRKLAEASALAQREPSA